MVTDVRPVLDAVRLCAPTVAPSVHVVPIWPAALVAPVAGATEPPPEATANVTVCPEIALPNASVTLTIACCGSVVLTTAVWLPPLVSASEAAAAGLIVSGTAFDVRLPADATSVYPVLALAIDMFAKSATPPTAVTVTTPLNEPAAGLAPNASVTLPVNVVASTPCASRATTWIAGRTAPAVAAEGADVKTSCVAVPPAPVVAVAPTVSDVRAALATVRLCAPGDDPSVHVAAA